MQLAQWSSRVRAAADGGSEGPRFTGASCLHALRADWKAGEDGLIPATARLNPAPLGLGSGKLDTPWARMQRARFNASCWSCVGLELEPLPAEDPEPLDEPEPQAAITVPARIKAMPAESLEAGRPVTR
jgi:hypothetical protein